VAGDKVFDLEKIYREVTRGMLKELVKYVEGKEVVLTIDGETKIVVKFEKLKISEKN